MWLPWEATEAEAEVAEFLLEDSVWPPPVPLTLSLFLHSVLKIEKNSAIKTNKNACINEFFLGDIVAQRRGRKFKKVQANKLVKSNTLKFFFRKLRFWKF